MGALLRRYSKKTSRKGSKEDHARCGAGVDVKRHAEPLGCGVGGMPECVGVTAGASSVTAALETTGGYVISLAAILTAQRDT